MKIILLTFLISFHIYANNIFDAPGAIGDVSSKIRSSWSGSSCSGSCGLEKKLSKKECYQELEIIRDGNFWNGNLDNFNFRIDNETISLNKMYSISTFDKELRGYNIDKSSDKPDDYHYINMSPRRSELESYVGIEDTKKLSLLSYSPKLAPHLISNCDEFYLERSSEIKQVNFDGNDSKDFKSCLVTNIYIDDLSYNLYACVGDNRLYVEHI